MAMRRPWRVILSLAILFAAGAPAMGQTEADFPQYPVYVQYPDDAPPVTPAGQMTLTPDQIDQLVAPIALYPDPLLSLIFTGATYPDDIASAEQWLQDNPNPTEADIDAQNWDGSVKALVHYPTVLKAMNDQMDWTQALGAAFLNQQQDVLASVQRLRAQAQAAGNLQSTAQEQIVDDNGAIRIEPVDPNVLYVPQYDPNLVYTGPCPIYYGDGYPIGLWCDDDFDWGQDVIVVGGGWYSRWHHPEDWDRHPPAWNHHPPGWVASPKAWARATGRPPPRITPGAISHLGLNRPRAGAVGRTQEQPQIGREPAAEPSRNVFDSSENRQDVQREDERARPIAARPVESARPVEREEPRPEAPPVEERPAPQYAEPPSAPENAFGGGSGGEARAASARGHASGRR